MALTCLTYSFELAKKPFIIMSLIVVNFSYDPIVLQM